MLKSVQPLWAMFGSVVQRKPADVLMSEAHVTIEAHADIQGLGCCMKPC